VRLLPCTPHHFTPLVPLSLSLSRTQARAPSPAARRRTYTLSINIYCAISLTHTLARALAPPILPNSLATPPADRHGERAQTDDVTHPWSLVSLASKLFNQFNQSTKFNSTQSIRSPPMQMGNYTAEMCAEVAAGEGSTLFGVSESDVDGVGNCFWWVALTHARTHSLLTHSLSHTHTHTHSLSLPPSLFSPSSLPLLSPFSLPSLSLLSPFSLSLSVAARAACLPAAKP
jgi:hypothetical protein